MRLLHGLAKIHASFDDPNLVSRAGLVPVMALAQYAGLAALAGEQVAIADRCGVNPHLKVPGLPLIGHTASAPSRSSQGRLSAAACARHSLTEVADGASSVTTMPSTHREHTSIASVRYGRPTGSRCFSSTTITSTGV